MFTTVSWTRALLIGVIGALVGTGCATSFDVEAAIPASPTPPGQEDDTAGGIGPGACFTDDELRLVDGDPVACDRPHIAEVFAVSARTEPPGAPWPGLDIVQRDASDFCNDAFGQEFGVAGQISVLDILFFRPQEETWSTGDREIACFVRFPTATADRLSDLDPLRAFGTTSTFGLESGDCVASPSLVADVAVDLVDCDEPHWFEVYASAPMLDGPYPGEETVLEFADATCRATFEGFVGIPRDESLLRVERLFPTEQSWNAWGDRLVTCVLSADEQLTGSLAGTQR
ncbi:MAG: septum formation family protein [Actinomycetota bacterium]